MFGQGCPHFVIRFCVLAISTIVFAIAPFRAPKVGFGQNPETIASSARTNSTSKKMRLRFSWGGGEPQTWVGAIKILNVARSEASMSNVSPLGLTADAPASVIQKQEQAIIKHWSPTNYGGADISFTGTDETQIQVTVSSTENPNAKFEKTLVLREIWKATDGGDIDTVGNRCSISRVPGDLVEFNFSKKHLVFQSGESFGFSIRPNLTGITTRSAKARVKVVSANPTGIGVRPHFSKSVSFELDQNGSAEDPIDFAIKMPETEGIYNIDIELEPVWYQATFNIKKNTIKRTVQVIVLDDQSPANSASKRNWRQVSVVDAADVEQSELFPGWNQFSKMAGRQIRSIVGNESRNQVLIGQEVMLQLEPGGWQAIPLQMDRQGKPHVIELEYVAGGEMALGLSLLQPDASGQIPLYGFDSGVFIPDSLVSRDEAESKSIQRHRLTVWPETATPYLLVANRHGSDPATIGKIRVFSGPDQLDSSGVENTDTHQSRKLMAFYETPLFPENFGAREKVDPTVSESLDDWRMFYQGARRLVEYLKANSYRGAFITVACDGSSIYPSEFLASSPKHDNGVFFSNGQDPVRKDILEMMFRMFEREGLILVPSFALSGPLPEVESSRPVDGLADFSMIDLNQQNRDLKVGGRLPIYSPLNRKVQRSVTRIVGELSDRYKGYPAFEGVAIVCRPDTYTMLPGRQWGYGESTITQFLQSQPGLSSSQIDFSNRAAVQNLLLGTHRKQWTQWRAEQMTSWYQAMFKTMRRSIPNGKLYLAPVDLYRNEETAAALSPSLHASSNFEELMLHVGFDIEALESAGMGTGTEKASDIVLLNPHRIAPDQTLASQRVDLAVETSAAAKHFYSKASYSGDLFTHRISWAHFAQLQELGLFGSQETPLMRLQQMAPAQQFNRKRFVQCIKERDARMLIDGGWMLTMGQETALLEMMQVFNRLPDQKFNDVVSSHFPDSNDSLPIAIRQLTSQNGETYFYVANASPWRIRLTIDVGSNSKTPKVQSLSNMSGQGQSFSMQKKTGAISKVSTASETVYEMSFEIPAYGFKGGKSADAGFVIKDFTFSLPPGADKTLKKQVYSLQAKLLKSATSAPMNVIENSGFDTFGQPSLSGWDSGKQSTENIRLNSRPADPNSLANNVPNQTGQSSLLLANKDQTPVWIRSNIFEGPETGRLSISVWLRTNNPGEQPPLRLSVEGVSNGSNYYRFGSVGSLSPDPKLNQVDAKWKRFAVHFDDLPVDGLSNVRVGFDLMGPGEVEVDHVQVFDRWFDENDAKAVTQMLASTGPLLSKPEKFDSCRRLLGGYWTRFLDHYISTTPEPVASQPTPIQSEILSGSQFGPEFSELHNPEEFQAEEQSKPRLPMFRRFRNLVPQRNKR